MIFALDFISLILGFIDISTFSHSSNSLSMHASYILKFLSLKNSFHNTLPIKFFGWP